MAWLPMIAATTAIGAIQGDAQRRAQQRANEQQANMAAAQTQYSPWTHMGAGQANIQPVTQSGFGGAVQGGLSGAMFGQGMQNQKDLMAMLKNKNQQSPSATPEELAQMSAGTYPGMY